MASLQLTLLGGFQARSDKNVPMAIPVKKAKALFAYLALHPGQRHPRDKLAALLWEDRSEAQARHSLRQTLVGLRKALPEPAQIIQADDDGVTVLPHAIAVDVLEFERFLNLETAEALEQAVALYQGELLEGSNPGSSGFEDWLMERRSRLRERAIAAAEHLLVQQLADQPGARAITLALRLVAWDPLRESAQRALMALYARSGQYGAALRQYQRCRTVLHRELGVEPEPQTEALYQELLKQRRAVVADPPLPVRPSPESDPSHPPLTPDAPRAQPTLHHPPEAPELRQVSILIARLAENPVNEPLDREERHREERHAAQQQLLARVHAVSQQFGGYLIQPAETVLLVFGVPQAHGNEAERAVRAALALQQADADPDPVGNRWPVRMGLASGPVLASHWRADDPHAYMVTGDALQEADRWSRQAGPGEILISGALYASLRERLIVEALEEPTEGVHAWRLRGLNEEPRFEQSAFVGRRGPLLQFIGALAACDETGCGQALLVRGDAGIGKSRLVEECATMAQSRGFFCHRALIFDFGLAAGQDPLLVLVRGVLGLHVNTSADAARTVATRAIEDGIIEKAQAIFLNDLLNLPQPADRRAEYDAMRHEVRQQGRQAVMSQLIAAAAARQAQLLVVEDIHWADTATLDGLARMAAMTRDYPVVLVMTSRLEGEPLDPTWRGAMQGASLLTLDLGPLRAEEAWAFSRSFDALEADQVARCIERAGGNPLFLEQLLRAAHAGETQIPDSIQSLVWARLDQLTLRDRTAAQAASILGQRFTLDALRYLLDDPDYRCDPLIEQRLARRDCDGFLFAHGLIQEGIYASLRKTWQRELHQRAAEWFAPRDRRLHAEHLDRAGDPAAAQAYLRAAREQVSRHHLDLALPLAQRGRAFVSDAPTAYALTCLHGDLLRETGWIEESIAVFEQALTAASHGTEQARVWIGIAEACGIQDRYAQALDALDQAQHHAGLTAPADLLAQIHYQRGNLCFPLGQIDACFREHERALEYARAAGSPALEARALSGLGDAYYQRGRMLTAHHHYHQCVARCREYDLAGIEAANRAMRGLTRFYQNDGDGAERDATAAAESAARIGNKRDESLAFNVLGLIYQYRGCWEQAREVIEKSLNLARLLGAPRFEAENLGNLAFVNARLGQKAQAEHLMEQAWALSAATGATYVGPWLLSLWARVTDEAERRTALLKEGEALLGAGSISHNYLHFYQNAIEVVLNDHHWPEVERYAAALAAYTAAEPLPWSDFFIARARRLAKQGRGERDFLV
jgi:DNA-binding SARP family transcriptional activator